MHKDRRRCVAEDWMQTVAVCAWLMAARQALSEGGGSRGVERELLGRSWGGAGMNAGRCGWCRGMAAGHGIA